MRKLLSILLLAIFGLPLVTPLFASGVDEDASVPVCCRRNGQHHCLMSAGEREGLGKQGKSFGTISAKCPYSPGITAAVQLDLRAVIIPLTFSSLVASHPTGIVQTESKRRISRDRSRQKRGPPPTSLL